ncbi:MAG TPA: hypothetical protein VEU75_07535, partial [Candidatus Acidoferrum sp.]|nr:hypothetical protein [Candidatus Acidoferrum sp.]
ERPTPKAFGAALPLSYPGEIGGDKGQSHDLWCQRERAPDLYFLLFLLLIRLLPPSMQEND